jgi:hypothetical protein
MEFFTEMSAATFKIKVLPKRMAKKSEAANYCGLPIKRFEDEFPFPPVRMPGGDDLIDLQDCDRWIETLKAGVANDDDDAILAKLGT